MQIEEKDVVDRLQAYLDHHISLSQLVNWAERAMMDGAFVGENREKVRDIVARLGVADVFAFGLSWEDFEQALTALRYGTEVRIFCVSGLN